MPLDPAEVNAVGQSTLDAIVPLMARMALAAAGGERAPAQRVAEMFGAVSAGVIAAVVTSLHEIKPEDERNPDELRAAVVSVVDDYLRQLFPDWHGSN